jgi:hypothetical protein
MALNPDQGLKYRLPMMTPHEGLRPRQVGHVDVQPFNPELGSFENLFNYAEKATDQIGASYKLDCWGTLSLMVTKMIVQVQAPMLFHRMFKRDESGAAWFKLIVGRDGGNIE